MSWFMCARCQQRIWRESKGDPSYCPFCAKLNCRKSYRHPEEPSPMQENAVRILEEGPAHESVER